jgi:integrase
MRSHAYSLLKSIFRTAVAHRLVTESPVAVEGATARSTPKDITLLTIAQVQALADAMPARHRLLVLLAAWCGLRFGELTGLRSRDINLDQETITIEQAAVTFVHTVDDEVGHRMLERVSLRMNLVPAEPQALHPVSLQDAMPPHDHDRSFPSRQP